MTVTHQAALGGVSNGLEIFRAACTRAGLLGFLLAFICGFLAYALALTAATVLLKWILVGRMRPGVHKCALSLPLSVLADGGSSSNLFSRLHLFKSACSRSVDCGSLWEAAA